MSLGKKKLQNMNSVVLVERVVSHCKKTVQRPPAMGREQDPGSNLGALSGGLCSPLSVTSWAAGGARQRRGAASNH